jgi:chromosome partitioning protein
MAETIAVLSLKGGTGKTTTVRTLADVLRRVGLSVLVIDLDPQGNLSDYFDVPADAAPTVADVLGGDAKASEAVHDGIIPATPILAEVERTMSGKMGRELVLRKALKGPRQSYDVILIDCPPALGLLTWPPTGHSCRPRRSTSRSRASRARSTWPSRPRSTTTPISSSSAC